MAPERRPIVSFGRRRGRRIRAGRQSLIATTLPRFGLEPCAAPGSVDPATLFDPRPEQVWLEIGFGAGEHLAAQAMANPTIGLIGAEPYINGVASLSARLDTTRLNNVRIFPDDGRLFLPGLRDASISRVFVLFPDPWPKTRHHKRRLLGPAFVAELARLMADDSELRVATDDRPYLVEILSVLTQSKAFAWLAQGPGDWRERPADWPPTRYEQKALEAGRAATYLRFKRLRRRGESV